MSRSRNEVLGPHLLRALNERWFGKPVWNFWLADEDRSTGWTNHGYVLQFVCAGKGRTPEQAWASAQRGEIADLGIPEDFERPDRVIAIRENAEHGLDVA